MNYQRVVQGKKLKGVGHSFLLISSLTICQVVDTKHAPLPPVPHQKGDGGHRCCCWLRTSFLEQVI